MHEQADYDWMPIERKAYEIEEFWDPTKITKDDKERIEVIASTIPNDVDSILDAGCGGGILLNYLSSSGRRFSRLCGVDRAHAALQHVQTEKYTASIDRLPFADGSFDAVTSLEVIEHLPQDIYGRALQEMARVSCKYVIVSVPNDENLQQSLVQCDLCRTSFNPNYHMRAFNESALTSLLDQYGFDCMRTFGIQGQVRCAGYKAVSSLRQRKTNPMPWFAICPMCGHQRHETNRGVGIKEQRRLHLLDAIRSVWPKTKHYTWLGAVYRKRVGIVRQTGSAHARC